MNYLGINDQQPNGKTSNNDRWMIGFAAFCYLTQPTLLPNFFVESDASQVRRTPVEREAVGTNEGLVVVWQLPAWSLPPAQSDSLAGTRYRRMPPSKRVVDKLVQP